MLLDNFKYKIPNKCLLTDDPYKVKMIASHFLDNVNIFSELRGQVALTACYKGIPIVVLSAGIGALSTMAYLTELRNKYSIDRIVYVGDCVTSSEKLPVNSTVIAGRANRLTDENNTFPSEALLKISRKIAIKNGIAVDFCTSTTNDGYLIDKCYKVKQDSDILDYSTFDIYKLNNPRDFESLSILTVCENVGTGEKIDEAVRQSRCNIPVLLALDVLITSTR